MSVFHASVLLLTMNFRHNIVKVVCECTRLLLFLVDPQLLWQCHDEIHDQWQDRRMKNWRQFVNITKQRNSETKHQNTMYDPIEY